MTTNPSQLRVSTLVRLIVGRSDKICTQCPVCLGIKYKIAEDQLPFQQYEYQKMDHAIVIRTSRKPISQIPKRKATTRPKAHGNTGANNGMWKGDKVGLIALHEWL